VVSDLQVSFIYELVGLAHRAHQIIIKVQRRFVRRSNSKHVLLSNLYSIRIQAINRYSLLGLDRGKLLGDRSYPTLAYFPFSNSILRIRNIRLIIKQLVRGR
jgi:hypothetical protein